MKAQLPSVTDAAFFHTTTILHGAATSVQEGPGLRRGLLPELNGGGARRDGKRREERQRKRQIKGAHRAGWEDKDLEGR